MKESLEISANLCREFEGLRLKPYLCPAGYWTIGYGTVNKPDNTKVKETDPPISKEIANEWLLHELKFTYLPGILKASPILIKYPKALGALTDFAYNLGVPRYRSSTLRLKINQEDFDSARYEIKRWVFARGKRLPGLVKRRDVESNFLF